MGVGGETDGEAVELGVVAIGVTVGPVDEGPVVVEGNVVVEHAACAMISTMLIGAAARFVVGAEGQKLSACLRCGRGYIGPAEANR